MKHPARTRLIEARKDRQWPQHEVADRLGTTQHNVSRWERGATTPTAYFQAKLCALFDKSPQELGLVEQAAPSPHASATTHEEGVCAPSPSPEAPSPLWTVPYPRNPFFLGRDEELAQIRSCLQTANALALSHPQAISGLGGIGKTQLALEYAYRSAQDYQAVLWARAESTEALIASYVAFAALFEIPGREEKEQAVIVEAVTRWLGTHQGWLLILDNADELAILPDFLPPTSGGHLLITTRTQATGRLASRIQIETLSPAQGALLLLRRAGWLASDAELSQASSEEQVLALQISEELGGLPLALDQAGAYLEETGIALAAYWQLYQQYRTALLQERRGGFVPDHPLPVVTTWSVSFQRIAACNPAAADLLRLLAWLPADAIAEEILPAGAALLGPVLAPIARDALLLNEAIEALRAASLIKRDPKTRMLSLHRLVQVVLQDQQDEGERRIWRSRVVQVVNAALPEVEHDTWPRYERLLPHALLAAQYIKTDQICGEEAGQVLAQTALYLKERARYCEAEPLFQQALAIWEHGLGTEHLLVTTSRYRLAEVYYLQGNYENAEPLLQQVLAIWEHSLGTEHPRVAALLHNLARLCFEQNRYEEAERFCQRALSLSEQHLGAEHPQVAYSLNNLALLYIEQGKCGEAELLLQRALSISEQCLGAKHPHMAYPLNNLADLYCQQGKYAEAELLYRQALSIWLPSLGTEHPNVAHPLTGLANLFCKQGHDEEAKPLYERALRIREQRLGLKHPDTAVTLHDLAAFQERQGNCQEALALYQRAFAIRQQVLGETHPKTCATRERLAALPTRCAMSSAKSSSQFSGSSVSSTGRGSRSVQRETEG